jgi:hypothetical protein
MGKVRSKWTAAAQPAGQAPRKQLKQCSRRRAIRVKRERVTDGLEERLALGQPSERVMTDPDGTPKPTPAGPWQSAVRGLGRIIHGGLVSSGFGSRRAALVGGADCADWWGLGLRGRARAGHAAPGGQGGSLAARADRSARLSWQG